MAGESSNLKPTVKSSTNGSVSKVVLKKATLAVLSNLPELNGSALAQVSPSSSSISMRRIPKSLLEEVLNHNTTKVDSFSPDTKNSSSSSSLILKAEPSPEFKTELLAGYLNMSLEAIIEANAFDHVERMIVNSFNRETTNAFRQNILKDFTTRLKNFKESVPKAMSTLQSSSEFMSKYENLNMKLNEGPETIEDLETKLSETLAKEYTIEMEIQPLIHQKNEILAKKNFLESQLDNYTKVVSNDFEKLKGLEEELKLCTDSWLKSKEDLAHANASWKIFKEILRL